MPYRLVCGNCDKKVSKGKFIHRLKGVSLCNECYRGRRLERRKKSKEVVCLENLKEKEEVRKRIIKRKSRRDYKKRKRDQNPPEPKGSIKLTKKRILPNCYLTLQEKQSLFRILKRKGLEDEEAKERVLNLLRQQRIIREKMKSKNKSEEEIKQKQMKLLEELWNS